LETNAKFTVAGVAETVRLSASVALSPTTAVFESNSPVSANAAGVATMRVAAAHKLPRKKLNLFVDIN
jgi:hypothetical protein